MSRAVRRLNPSYRSQLASNCKEATVIIAFILLAGIGLAATALAFTRRASPAPAAVGGAAATPAAAPPGAAPAAAPAPTPGRWARGLAVAGTLLVSLLSGFLGLLVGLSLLGVAIAGWLRPEFAAAIEAHAPIRFFKDPVVELAVQVGGVILAILLLAKIVQGVNYVTRNASWNKVGAALCIVLIMAILAMPDMLSYSTGGQSWATTGPGRISSWAWARILPLAGIAGLLMLFFLLAWGKGVAKVAAKVIGGIALLVFGLFMLSALGYVDFKSWEAGHNAALAAREAQAKARRKPEVFMAFVPARGRSEQIKVPVGKQMDARDRPGDIALHVVFADGGRCVVDRTCNKSGHISYVYFQNEGSQAANVRYRFVPPT